MQPNVNQVYTGYLTFIKNKKKIRFIIASDDPILKSLSKSVTSVLN